LIRSQMFLLESWTHGQLKQLPLPRFHGKQFLLCNLNIKTKPFVSNYIKDTVFQMAHIYLSWIFVGSKNILIAVSINTHQRQLLDFHIYYRRLYEVRSITILTRYLKKFQLRSSTIILYFSLLKK
jgi:hypothetical protein